MRTSRKNNFSKNTLDHYAVLSIQPIEVVDSWCLGFHLGNVIKYIGRAKHKGTELEDLKKAKFYLDRYIEKKEKVK